MIRRPPRSTLFPTRRSSDLLEPEVAVNVQDESRDGHRLGGDLILGDEHVRSEEHTSELQSRLHLVCRLLLEKKNKRFGVISHGCARDYDLQIGYLTRCESRH